MWELPLDYSFVYVFISPLHAAAALRSFPTEFIPLYEIGDGKSTSFSDPTLRVQFQICSQCNTYGIRYPNNRPPSKKFLENLATEHRVDHPSLLKSVLMPVY